MINRGVYYILFIILYKDRSGAMVLGLVVGLFIGTTFGIFLAGLFHSQVEGD